MSEQSMAAKDIKAALNGVYPPAFLEGYDLIECLAAGHGTETFLVRRKDSGEACIAKCYDRGVYAFPPEGAILKSLHHDGLPEFRDEFHSEEITCVVRQYIEGTPLQQYMAYGAPSTTKVLQLCARLTDILIYLHGQKKPVIHRDIKPSNIIVRPDGGLTLIDFDIARVHNSEAETDTRFIGTRVYAPPEQYGFSQSDCRTDIYSFGVLLCWMLTGRTNVRTARVTDTKLAAVVRRCTAFSPDDRYKSAADVKRALIKADGHRRRTAVRVLGTAAAVLLSLLAGYAIGRHTTLFARPMAGEVRFQEPLIERAVRIQLGIGADEVISTGDLAAVREIYIFGDEVASSSEPFAMGLTGTRKNAPRGEIASLEDVRMLPNLQTIYINHQKLSNIAPLAALTHLTYVNLRHTRVADITPLSGMKTLSAVNLYDTLVTDVSCLDTCPCLTSLEVGRTLISSVDALGGHASVKTLYLNDTALSSLKGIERFTALETLNITKTDLSDLTQLSTLPQLKNVVLDGSMRETVLALSNVSFKAEYE